MRKSFDIGQTNGNDEEIDADADTTTSGNIFDRFPAPIGSTPTPTPTGTIFMKIRLHESDDMLLFESNSYSILRNAGDAADAIADDNRHYDTMIALNAKQRRMHDIETQTVDAHGKTRAINTDHINKSSAGTFVSNYDMYDTYANLETVTEHIPIDYNDRHDQLNITTYVHRSGDNDAGQREVMLVLANGNEFTGLYETFQCIKNIQPKRVL